jgi:hypothetical protein
MEKIPTFIGSVWFSHELNVYIKIIKVARNCQREISGNQQSAEVALTSEKHNADAIHGIRVGTRFEEPSLSTTGPGRA